MSVQLLLFNTAYLVSIIMNVGLGGAVLWNDPKRKVNILLFLTSFVISIFSVATVIGINSTDSDFSRNALLFSVCNLFLVAVNCHWVLAVIGLDVVKRKMLILFYGAALALFIFFITDTSRFLLTSEPKMYFPNYFVPGSHYWLFILFFTVTVFYFIYNLLIAFLKATGIEKKRLKYFLSTYIIGYTVGSVAFLLAYDLKIDPFISSFVGFYTAPLAYGILKYDLMDIHVIAKKAIGYAVLTGLLSIIITLISYSNNLIVVINPAFPSWLIPLITSILSVFIGAFVWEQIREADLLKYEFINNVTHKFRSPITHIRWLAEDLRKESSQEERDKAVQQIQYASMRLFELTNILIDTSRNDSDDHLYRFLPGNVGAIVTTVCTNHRQQINEKDLDIRMDIAPDLPAVTIDERRLQFAIQILLENALIYTPKGGSVVIRLLQDGDNLVFQIKDSGIGIAKAELSHMFSKFYRAQNARHTDTEGMGIGLFMAKSIIAKHGGEVWVESEGQDKGSTFSFTLPIK